MAANNFEKCLKATLVFEGGDVHHSKDPGGRTSQGVTQATYNAHRKRLALPQRSVFDMSPGERDEIYRAQFWDKVAGDDLPAGVDFCVFDFGVNSGPARAVKHGANARKAAEEVSAQIHHICDARMKFLKRLKTWPHFGKGWTRRVESCREQALKMAEESED